MSLKSLFARPFASFVYQKIKKGTKTAVADQQAILSNLLKQATKTSFGKDHEFDKINSYNDFKKNVPIRDYEQLKSYIDRIKKGEADILWKGKPIYFAKTSGTTSGIKYIPITKESIPNHINTARNALLCYMVVSGNYSFINGKLIFLSGSPVLDETGGIPTGRLSGIVNHHV
ncbi:MAG TPA: GH3 auxin-responsive promoter family protein, partial [Segetibacter sp.]|nr:GH3 auxin-responsive promoter family protein [Segetibacter sp.]